MRVIYHSGRHAHSALGPRSGWVLCTHTYTHTYSRDTSHAHSSRRRRTMHICMENVEIVNGYLNRICTRAHALMMKAHSRVHFSHSLAHTHTHMHESGCWLLLDGAYGPRPQRVCAQFYQLPVYAYSKPKHPSFSCARA